MKSVKPYYLTYMLYSAAQPKHIHHTHCLQTTHCQQILADSDALTPSLVFTLIVGTVGHTSSHVFLYGHRLYYDIIVRVVSAVVEIQTQYI